MDKQEQQLAKPKNEVRVAAGRKLVERNRKNKENLIKNKEQVGSSGEPSPPTSAEEPVSAASNTTLYGCAAVALAGIAAFYFWKRNTTPQPAVAKPENDIASAAPLGAR